MSSRSTQKHVPGGRPRLRVRLEQPDAAPSEFAFTGAFRIGRGTECELRIESGLVSRIHAEVVFEDGVWWVRDRGSTNGLYVAGEKTGQVRLDAPVVVQLGLNAPMLHFALEQADGDFQAPWSGAVSPGLPGSGARRSETPHPAAPPPRILQPTQEDKLLGGFVEKMPTPPPSRPSAGSGTDPSVSQIIKRYFDEDSSRPAGEHTMMIRQAFAQVKKKHARRYVWIISAVVVLGLAALGYAVVQQKKNEALRLAVADTFYGIKQQDLTIAQLLLELDELEGVSLQERLARIRADRDESARRYDGLVEELGIYRRLTDEEQHIYDIARIFNESQVDIPVSFIIEVKRYIQEQWLTPSGRGTFQTSIKRAQDNDYIDYIVRTFKDHGLPPQFFYLALQESNFNVEALGWYAHPTFGRAKGMWQFIPETGRRYDLFVPELNQNANVVVWEDERHDFKKSTVAAAEYLQEIYVTLAQASGLLVMASYNWGERRVVKRLSQLSGLENIDDADMPEDPRARSYWNFLTRYETQMPEQTKEYVLKIFAAAVIGQDPRRYNFNFDNPLQPYLETPLPDLPDTAADTR